MSTAMTVVTPHHIRALRSFPCSFHGSPPPAVAWAIAEGLACIDDHQTECYPDRGTSYRLTASGHESLARARFEQMVRDVGDVGVTVLASDETLPQTLAEAEAAGYVWDVIGPGGERGLVKR